MTTAPVIGRSVWALVIVLALAKLVLVSGHDVIASDTPFDDLWNIHAAAGWYWRRPYGEWVLMHLPVYPLYIAFLQPTGLPLRIAIELTYLSGAAAIAVSLVYLGITRWLVPIVFAIIAFHPYAVDIFDLARADTLYACLTLFMVAAFIFIASVENHASRIRGSIALALVTALAWHCRKESILIGAAFAVVMLALVAMTILRLLPRREAVALGLYLVATPIVAATLLGGLIVTANGLGYGLWSINELTAPNFVRALTMLQEVAPLKPIRRVGVTREARLMAYQESPAFAELQPLLDGPNDRWFTWVTRQEMGLESEIGSGWFHWALIWVTAEAGHFKTATESERYFGRIADELSAAFKAGRLPRRSMILPYIDPAIDVWLPYLPASTAAIARGVFVPSSSGMQNDQPGLDSSTVHEFDRMTNRRLRDTERHWRTIDRIARWYATGLAIVLPLVVGVTLAWPTARPLHYRPAFLVLIFVGTLISLRVVFFAILDASAWNGMQARYLFPASALVVVCLAVVGLLVGSIVSVRRFLPTSHRPCVR